MQLEPHIESLVLACSCGEKTIIFGRVEDWLPRDPVFRCGACGEGLTFSDDAKEEYYAHILKVS
jgi:predicted SprT family Zn-dependent metalloprotease